MADQKISQLNPLLAANTVDTDLVVLVKDPAGTPETVKMTVAEAKTLFGGGGGGGVIELSTFDLFDGATTPQALALAAQYASRGSAAAAATEIKNFLGFSVQNLSASDNNLPAFLRTNYSTASSFSVTASAGTNRVLVLAEHGTSTTQRTGYSWNGMSFTKLSGIANSSNFVDSIAIWYLVIGDSVTDETFTLTSSGGAGTIGTAVHVYDNVNQTTPFGLGATQSAVTAINVALTMKYGYGKFFSCYAGTNLNEAGLPSGWTTRQVAFNALCISGDFDGSDLANSTMDSGGYTGGVITAPLLPASASLTAEVQTSGVVSGFTGLTPGSTYYLSDTLGSISDTAGATSIQIGVAISATELLIKTS